MTQNPDQNQPAPDPADSNLGITDSPTPEQHAQLREQESADDGPKGDDLDKALEDAGLPKTGTADEKRSRLAEHQSGNTQS